MMETILVLTKSESERIEMFGSVDARYNKYKDCVELFATGYTSYGDCKYIVGRIYKEYGKIEAIAYDAKGKRKDYKTIRGLINFMIKEYHHCITKEVVEKLCEQIIGVEEIEIVEEEKDMSEVGKKETVVINEEINEKINSTYVTKGYRWEVVYNETIVYFYRIDEHGFRVKNLEKDIRFFMDKKEYKKMVQDGIIQLEEKIEFKPEQTAIDVKNSKSAEIAASIAKENTKILDYGCGTGRNIRFIKEKANVIVDGTDIPQQLERQKEKHNKLRDEKTVIEPAEKIPNEYYDLVLNSHVLNVIESDEVKKIVVKDMFEKLIEGGQAIIEVRTKSDVESAKTKERFGDGWKIKKGSSYTYQEAITKEKMTELVTSVGFKIEEHIYNSNKHILRVAK